MDTSADLRVLLASQYPLLLVSTPEEERFLGMLRSAAIGMGLPVWVWSAARGLARDGGEPMYGTADPRRALQFVADLRDPGIFVFTDVPPGVAVGDMVDVLGTVNEFFGFTEFDDDSVVTVSNHMIDLPSPVILGATVPSPDPAAPSYSGPGAPRRRP